MARRGSKRFKVQVKVNVAPLRKLRDDAEQVLRALDHPLRDATRRILDISLFLVPRGGAPDDELDLADTAFLSGPFFNPEKKSSTWTCGYAHPAAGAIHQGFHWGEALLPPPDFLRRATKGITRQLKKQVGQVLMREIARVTQQ